MKRIAVAFVVAFVSFAAAADEAFILSIPLRFNANQETGEVRVTFTLAAPPAGTQLIVNGTTLNLGATQTIGGDSVAFTAGSEPNTARLVYQPLSNFAGDFCQGGGAVQKDIPMRFVGGNITKYNMNSYLVAAPSAECSKASKRTNDMPALLIPNDDGVAPALDAENGGRQPLDVVLVLDKSGSMSELPPGANTGATKAEILRSAMTTFVATWSEMDVPYEDDRIGVVFFSNTAAPQSQTGGDPPSNFFVRRNPYDTGVNHHWFPLQGNINTLAPGGSTSVGAGINSGMQQWASDPDHDLSMLVVTDGKQNTAPLIDVAPSGFLTLTPVASFPAELRQRFVPIQSVGFGEPGTVDGELLTKLALETSGVSYISINAATMFDTLAMTLIAILKGNTAALALRHHDVMSTTAPSAPQSVLVDRSVKRAVFSVQWAPPLREALELEVIRPDGTVATPDSSRKTPQSALQSFDMGKNAVGTWKVRVKRPKNLTSVSTPRVPYTLHTYFVERDLEFHVALDPQKAFTGDAITVRAQVSYDGKPLDKLRDGSITVRVQRPAASLGTILHETRAQTASTTVGGDTISAYDQKVSQLPRGLLKRITPSDVATLTLTHVKNGLYTGTFTDTSTAGQYGFETVLQWDDRRTGQLRREERLETFVQVRPDFSISRIETSANVRGTVTVTVTPRDRFGNFLGPGYASRLHAKTNAGRLDSKPPLDRDQTGTYVFTIREVPEGAKPVLEFWFDGMPLREK